MTKNYQYIKNSHSVTRFTDTGKGLPIVLLHGYLETLDVWTDFASELSQQYRVICIDIMGHGETHSKEEIFTVELSAQLVTNVLDFLNIESAFIVGHSMGGYTMLAMEELYSNRVSAMCFFHSISWADTDEKKANRDREIQLIKKGKLQLLSNEAIPKSFANDNITTFAPFIEALKLIAMQLSNEGIIAALKEMKERPDRTFILEKTIKPVLFFIGKKDNYIPEEKLLRLTERVKNKTIVMLENSGHIGFVEEKEKSVQATKRFIEQILSNNFDL